MKLDLRQRLESLEDYLDDQTWWQNTYWPVWRFFNRYGPRALYIEAKYFIQRGRRGYSDRDLWNADDTIARIALAFLEKGPKPGIPVVSTKDDEPWEESEKRWREIESELQWLMRQHIDYDSEDYWSKNGSPAYRKRRDRANRLFGKYWMSLWD